MFDFCSTSMRPELQYLAYMENAMCGIGHNPKNDTLKVK